MAATTPSHQSALPQQTFQRLSTEMNEIGTSKHTSDGVTRVENAEMQRVDTWQPSKQGHTVETYVRNADGSISKHYNKTLLKGVREETTLRVGPNGSVRETTYTRNGQQTTIRITTLKDGTRTVTRERSGEPADATTPSQPQGTKTGTSRPDGTPATPSEERGPSSSSATPQQCPPTFQERFERDRQQYYDFFQQHPIQGEQNREWFVMMRQKLADEGNTFAIREIQRVRERDNAFNESMQRDLREQEPHFYNGPLEA